MRTILTYGGDIFALDQRGNSALHLSACSDNYRDALRELLAWLTDTKFINIVNDERKTPLHIAAENCAVKCVRELLKVCSEFHSISYVILLVLIFIVTKRLSKIKL
ncbi:unnamed protein product [Anisakis simplex]|uniref:ANK_REP_REGION domain-containing protein n=1 Tax=Anisakis simplex TaxID=6269 RepID=A0A0M3JGL0_ANISI|nr:unnamed protein product [Anisakis simplex]